MLQNFTHFLSKKMIAKYGPFVGQFWSEQVMLFDSFKLFWPLVWGGSIAVLSDVYHTLLDSVLQTV